VALAEAAGGAWGPGWASSRTQIAVMGSPPIVSAIERSASFSAPPAGKAPATVISDSVAAARPTAPPVLVPRAPAPPTAAVRPTSADARRHVSQQPAESHEAGSLHEIPVISPLAGGRRKPDRGRAALVAGVAVLAGVVVALVLALGGSKEEPAPKSSAAPTSTLAAAPALFTDDFADPASGWTQTDQPSHRLAYVGGKYLILVRQPDTRVTSDTSLEGPAYRADLVALNDAAIEVDADRITAIPARFGLLCRQQQNGDFYMAVVDSAGRARIEKLADGDRRTLGDQPLAGADAAGPRRLRLECVGGPGSSVTLRLFVDGNLAVEGSDQTPLAPGGAGVVAVSLDRAGVQILFDNFLIAAMP
jgi:hypothetical protein